LTLPNEITSEIFIHFLPIYPLRPPLVGILSPTNLTQFVANGERWRWPPLRSGGLWT
jgi:hypothetical protein